MERFSDSRRGAPLIYYGNCDGWFLAYTYAEAASDEVLERANLEAFRRLLDLGHDDHDCYRIETFGGAFGRGSWLFVNPDCAEAVAIAEQTLAALEDYPVIDEELWSEYEEADAFSACRDAVYRFVDEPERDEAADYVLSYALDHGRDTADFYPSDSEVFWGVVAYRRNLRASR